MKSVLSTLLAVSCAAAALASDVSSLNGKWQLHQSIADNESEMVCTFTQTGSELTGICDGEQRSVKITGKVDGTKVSWVYKSEYDGGPVTLTYKGTLNPGDKLSGTVAVEEYGADGEFTATRGK